jgi:cystathionine beta-lyase
MYPPLASDPGHAIWKRDFTGATGVFGVELAPVPKRAVDAFLNTLTLFGMGASFGGFESLAIPIDPAPFRATRSWHADGPCVRLHIGLEHPDDLIADLERGLAALRASSGGSG